MKRYTYEFVKQSFEKERYTLVSKEYINNTTKLDYTCPEGHEHSVVYKSWKKGFRCPHCAGIIKLTIDIIRESFKQENYILISKKYVNNKTKLNYVCSNGHEHSITWNNWQKGKRCIVCAYNNKKLTLEHITLSFEQDGCVLLSKEYINSYTKLDYICKNGHKHSIKWNDWDQGHRCLICKSIEHSINNSGAGHPNWQGGISCTPYCEVWKDKEYKEDIKFRDGCKCLNPSCNKNNSRLTIHHIDYNKKNCGPTNLITICNSCNVIANTNREWHTAWYQALMYRRYKYEYRKF